MATWPLPVKTWVHDEEPPASTFNTEIRDRFIYLYNNGTALGKFFSGLVLGTHPDAGTSKILLRTLRNIVLDNGIGLSNVSNLTADMSLSGAGGLDASTEQADTWYEIYLIHRESDGTKNLLLHRAKDYFLDETYDSDDTTTQIRRATNTRAAYSQGFKVDTTGPCEFVDVELIRVGAVSGSLYAEIQSDNAGKPSGSVLATSDYVDAGSISTSAQYIRLTFRVPATLTATTQYHLVLTGTWTQSDAVYIGWRTDTSAPSYANGAGSHLQGGVWAADGTATDASFKLYITRNDTAVTMPAGYVGKALVGYVRNNFASDFLQFDQRDRTVVPLSSQSIYSSSSISALTLTDLSGRIPPTPVILWPIVDLGAGTSATSSPNHGILGVAVDNSSLSRVAGSVKLVAAAGTIVEVGPLNLSAYQHCYVINNGSGSAYIGTWSW